MQQADATTVDVVEVTLPARRSYVSVLRTTAAALATRVDFTVDEIEDLRIAVDEGCALLLSRAESDSPVHCRFELAGRELRVRVSVAVPTAADHTADQAAAGHETTALSARTSFAWTVLTALTDSAEVPAGPDGQTRIELVKKAHAVHAPQASAATNDGERPHLRAVDSTNRDPRHG